MPIKDFLMYFGDETKATIKAMQMDEYGERKYYPLFDARKIRDILHAEKYYESILNRMIDKKQITIIDSVIIIIIED